MANYRMIIHRCIEMQGHVEPRTVAQQAGVSRQRASAVLRAMWKRGELVHLHGRRGRYSRSGRAGIWCQDTIWDRLAKKYPSFVYVRLRNYGLVFRTRREAIEILKDVRVGDRVIDFDQVRVAFATFLEVLLAHSDSVIINASPDILEQVTLANWIQSGGQG